MFLVIVWVYFPRLWVYITGIEDSVGMMILSFAFVVMEVKVMVKVCFRCITPDVSRLITDRKSVV